MMFDQELGDGCQVVSNYAPTNPTFHPLFAMSQAAVQVSGTSQLADATLDPIAETLCGSEPRLPLVLAAMVGLVARLGQAEPLHPQSARLLFVIGRVHAAIASDFLGWLAEQLAVMAEARDQELCFIRVALQEAIFANQSSIDFAIPNLATELGLFGFGFAAADQG